MHPHVWLITVPALAMNAYACDYTNPFATSQCGRHCIDNAAKYGTCPPPCSIRGSSIPLSFQHCICVNKPFLKVAAPCLWNCGQDAFNEWVHFIAPGCHVDGKQTFNKTQFMNFATNRAPANTNGRAPAWVVVGLSSIIAASYYAS